MRIALKFAAAVTIGVFLLLAGQAYLQVVRERALFEADMSHDNRLMGRWLTAAAAELWATGGEGAVRELVQRADRASSSVRIRWVRMEDGTELSPVQPVSDLGGVQRGEEQVIVDRGPGLDSGAGGGSRRGLITYVPLLVAGKAEGALELIESFDAEQEYVRTSIARNAATAIALAVVSLLLTMLLGYRLIGQPVGSLVERAKRIGRGDLSLETTGVLRDELATLGAELDQMCDHLREARQQASSENRAKLEAIEQLRRADRLRTVGQLTSGIAHELGTPLNVIMARAGMISKGEVEGDAARASARTIGEQADRMQRTIRQLLDFARPRHPERRGVDLVNLAGETASLLASLATPRGVRIEVQPVPAPVYAPVDSSQIQQVLSNLIVNAMQAMPAGGVVTVSVKAEQLNRPWDPYGAVTGFVAVAVKDRGPGMSEAVRARIFEPFFTTKPPGEGTGLGLPVSAGIVHEHGGWIGVESASGQGSCFTVFLPQEPVDARTDPDR